MKIIVDKHRKYDNILIAIANHLQLEKLEEILMIDVIIDTLIDAVKLVPFLFLTYLLMEYIEHKTSEGFKNKVKKAGKVGPLWGGILGAFPQCGFSAAASSLYAGRVITVGTLIAIYLSTSDEMLPIFISENVSVLVILKIIGLKILIGMVAGFLVDLVFQRLIINKKQTISIGHLCEHDHCHCEKSIFKSSLKHTTQILLFIVIITFVLNTVIFFVGEDTLSGLILNRRILGPVIAGIVGLIPNCAASVVITQLYLTEVISFGSMMAGLLVGAGVGLLVLFKVNNHRIKENIKIVVALYIIGVIAGIVIELLGVTI